MKLVFDALKNYLPLIIPLILACITVVQRVALERGTFPVGLLLKTYPDLTLGLFGFLLWAYGSPSYKTGRVTLNPRYYLDSDDINILLMMAVALMLVGIFVVRRDWKTPQRQRAADIVMLAFTAMTISIPLQIKKPLDVETLSSPPAPRRFDVVVPYDDPTLVRHIGAQRWSDRLLVSTQEDIPARDEEEAIKTAVHTFQQSGLAAVLYPKRGVALATVISVSKIVVKERSLSQRIEVARPQPR